MAPTDVYIARPGHLWDDAWWFTFQSCFAFPSQKLFCFQSLWPRHIAMREPMWFENFPAIPTRNCPNCTAAVKFELPSSMGTSWDTNSSSFGTRCFLIWQLESSADRCRMSCLTKSQHRGSVVDVPTQLEIETATREN